MIELGVRLYHSVPSLYFILSVKYLHYLLIYIIYWAIQAPQIVFNFNVLLLLKHLPCIWRISWPMRVSSSRRMTSLISYCHCRASVLGKKEKDVCLHIWYHHSDQNRHPSSRSYHSHTALSTWPPRMTDPTVPGLWSPRAYSSSQPPCPHALGSPSSTSRLSPAPSCSFRLPSPSPQGKVPTCLQTPDIF